MNAHKRKSLGKQMERKKPLLESFALLFNVCKILGLVSQDWEEFRRYKQLKKSVTGERLVVVGIIICSINFNCMLFAFPSQTYISEKGPIAIGIGVILTYFSLALFISDRINALLKQQNFINIFLALDEIDEDLNDLNIILNNNYIKFRLLTGIIVATFIEGTTFTITFIIFINQYKWTMDKLLWIYGVIPSYFNTLDKLWYIGILIAIRQRFEALNNAFDREALNMEQDRLKEDKLKTAKIMHHQNQIRKYAFKNQIRPVTKSFQAVFGDEVVNPPIHSSIFESNIYVQPSSVPSSSNSTSSNESIYGTLEDEFVKYCQIHDMLCNVSKQLNQVYSFPILMLMGYGFFGVTALLYYFYSASVGQTIPAMFRLAKIWWLTGINIFYISSKCVTILYGNWLTSLESKKTGICLHRCAVAADKNDVYEMVNHLSLKLFNHQCNFNACGYFPLDMTTLFSFCGGITTYLIILIQFNLEEQQVKIENS